uniref:Uncharacterized protein n=1 Tax=Panagrolaimus sp. JU765 TaxID=591449 RepID=A0AC34RPH1_9BILA
MKLFVVIFLSIFGIVLGNIALRSVAIKGELKCGKTNAENAHVRLLRVFVDQKAKEELNDTLGGSRAKNTVEDNP